MRGSIAPKAIQQLWGGRGARAEAGKKKKG